MENGNLSPENLQLAKEFGFNEEEAKEALKNPSIPPFLVVPEPENQTSGEGKKVFITVDTGKILSTMIPARDEKTNQPIPGKLVEAKYLVVIDSEGLKRTVWLTGKTLRKAFLGLKIEYKELAGMHLAIYKKMVPTKFGKSKVYNVVPASKNDVQNETESKVVDNAAPQEAGKFF